MGVLVAPTNVLQAGTNLGRGMVGVLRVAMNGSAGRLGGKWFSFYEYPSAPREA